MFLITLKDICKHTYSSHLNFTSNSIIHAIPDVSITNFDMSFHVVLTPRADV